MQAPRTYVPAERVACRAAAAAAVSAAFAAAAAASVDALVYCWRCRRQCNEIFGVRANICFP